MRNVWGEIDIAARRRLHGAVHDQRSGRRPRVGTADDQTFQTQALAAGSRHDRVYTNSDDATTPTSRTSEFAVNRRFSGKWMMLRRTA